MKRAVVRRPIQGRLDINFVMIMVTSGYVQIERVLMGFLTAVEYDEAGSYIFACRGLCGAQIVQMATVHRVPPTEACLWQLRSPRRKE